MREILSLYLLDKGIDVAMAESVQRAKDLLQEVPFDLMQTEAGAQEVEDALGRIAEGVLV